MGQSCQKALPSPFLSPRENKISGPLHCHGHEQYMGVPDERYTFRSHRHTSAAEC